MTRANNWRPIGRISWRMASFKSFNVRGLSVNTRFQIPPKEKNNTLKNRESEWATARLRNGKWGAREICFEQWSLTRLQCALWHHLVEKHWHSPPPPGPTYWVLPIQKMSGSHGSPYITYVTLMYPLCYVDRYTGYFTQINQLCYINKLVKEVAYINQQCYLNTVQIFVNLNEWKFFSVRN